MSAEEPGIEEETLTEQDWEVVEQRAVLPLWIMKEWNVGSCLVLVDKAIDQKIRTKHFDVLHYYRDDPGGWLVRLFLRSVPDDIEPVYPDLPRSNRWRIWTYDDANGDELLIVLSRSRRFHGLELTTFFRPSDPTYRARLRARDRRRELRLGFE